MATKFVSEARAVLRAVECEPRTRTRALVGSLVRWVTSHLDFRARALRHRTVSEQNQNVKLHLLAIVKGPGEAPPLKLKAASAQHQKLKRPSSDQYRTTTGLA